MLVQDLLLHTAARMPDAEALVVGKRCFTFAELRDATLSLAVSLRRVGLGAGDRVAVLSDSPFDYIVSYFGTLLAGGIFVGVNTQTTTRAVSELLQDSAATVVIIQQKFVKYLLFDANQLPSLRTVVAVGGGSVAGIITLDFGAMLTNNAPDTPEVSRHPSDIAQIIYTSGTTGKAKGVALSHDNLVSNTHSIIAYLNLTARDSAMLVMPFFYSYGNSVLLTHIAVGAKLVVNQSLVFPQLILDQMVNEQVTGFPGVPSIFLLLLRTNTFNSLHLPSVRYLTQAGGRMAPAALLELKTAFNQAELYVMYGQTEAAPRLAFLDPADLQRKPGSIGKAIPGVTLAVCAPDGTMVKPGEVGELVASGKNIMLGYWRQTEATAEILRAGRLWTGDLASVDNEGFFYIVGRKTEMIKSGAHRIAPREIEEVLLEHDAVVEAAVFSVADPLLVEVIVACVVLQKPCSEKELRRCCRKSLPGFKVPHKISFYPQLPKTMSGKINKVALKDIFSLEGGADGH